MEARRKRGAPVGRGISTSLIGGRVLQEAATHTTRPLIRAPRVRWPDLIASRIPPGQRGMGNESSGCGEGRPKIRVEGSKVEERRKKRQERRETREGRREKREERIAKREERTEKRGQRRENMEERRAKREERRQKRAEAPREAARGFQRRPQDFPKEVPRSLWTSWRPLRVRRRGRRETVRSPKKQQRASEGLFPQSF